MVAYSFQKRFVPKIEAGTKRQTIRGHRNRHARVGEPMQIYFGMRTKHCRKIIDDPVCISVRNIQMQFDWETGEARYQFLKPKNNWPSGWLRIRDEFAIADGFRDANDLITFWKAVHKLEGAAETEDLFEGVLIEWAVP